MCYAIGYESAMKAHGLWFRGFHRSRLSVIIESVLIMTLLSVLKSLIRSGRLNQIRDFLYPQAETLLADWSLLN